MKLNIQKFGGRGASSTPIISKSLKRIYRVDSRGNKELTGYDYNGYNIEVEDEFFSTSRNYLGSTRRWYITTLKSGERTGSDRLFEVKEKIEEEIKRKRKKD